jgi:hypothetical protein
MAGSWRKRDEGRYAVTGPLSGGAGPGRRTVTWLELRRLTGADDLSLLAALPDLQTLELEHIDGADLAPLAGLGLKHLDLRSIRGVDLRVLAKLPLLEGLTVIDFEDVQLSKISLSPRLQWLAIINDDTGLTGAPVRTMVEAIAWEHLDALGGLEIRVGGLTEIRPIDLDLGFLRALPALERLDIDTGIRHVGARPSPVDPPFDGLSKRLSFVCIAADDPEDVEARLRDYLGIVPGTEVPGKGISVRRRSHDKEPRRPWSIVPPDGGGDGTWVTYGSLIRDGGDPDDTEYDACDRAQRRLRDTDPDLLRRLDLDPENAGTGIMAASREDLERALELLGVRR